MELLLSVVPDGDALEVALQQSITDIYLLVVRPHQRKTPALLLL